MTKGDSDDGNIEPSKVIKSDFSSRVASPVKTIAYAWSSPPAWLTVSCHFPDGRTELGAIFILSILFTESCTPFGTETPFTMTFPLKIVPSGAVSFRSRSLTSLDSLCGAFALPATSVQARVMSIPEEGSMSN